MNGRAYSEYLGKMVARLEARSWRKCLDKGRCGRGYISRHSLQPDYCAIRSAMQATGKASGPDHAHQRRVGTPTGRMTARPTTKQAMKERLKSQPHGVQDAERPRLRGHYRRVQTRPQTRVLLVHCRPNHLQTNISPWGQTTLGSCHCRYTDANLSKKIAKESPVRHTKSVQLLAACP